MSISGPSMLTLTSSLCGRAGVGDAGVASRLSALRRFRVTLLECGSVGGASTRGSGCGGVLGIAGSGASTFIITASDPSCSWDVKLSTDLLREPEPVSEVRRRFRAQSPSSKGLGRVEEGSEEAARSRDSEALESCSIWLKLEAFAREGSSAASRLEC